MAFVFLSKEKNEIKKKKKTAKKMANSLFFRQQLFPSCSSISPEC